MRPAPSPTAVYDSFNDAYPDQAVVPAIRQIAGVKPTGENAIRDRSVREARARMLRQGWITVTVVNLHPFQLDLNMGFLGHLTIPGKKQGELYATKYIDQPRMDMEDKGDNRFQPVAYMPKDIAEDLVKNYTTGDNNFGGVFYFEGNGEVPKDLLVAAEQSQLDWYWRLFQAGNENWAQHNRNPKFITDRMRDAAKELFRSRLISNQPEWIVITKNESPDTGCEGCGALISKTAAFCQHCHTIYNPEWVKARRPDIWIAQNPASALVDARVTQIGASSVESSNDDVAKLIERQNSGELDREEAALQAARANKRK